MRLNELLSLRILDIDFGQNEIIIRHGKGDKDRHVMIYTHVLNKGPSGVVSPLDRM